MTGHLNNNSCIHWNKKIVNHIDQYAGSKHFMPHKRGCVWDVVLLFCFLSCFCFWIFFVFLILVLDVLSYFVWVPLVLKINLWPPGTLIHTKTLRWFSIITILGIERSKIKAGINRNFSLSGKTVVESNEGSDRAPVMSTPIQSTSSAFKHGCTKSRSIKKVEDALPKIPHKRKEVLL